ncbi:hypothetical protein [Streptomyces sp. AM6-12]|uniref:hypothetical protein n=1 Tax=Streptomyces sp. AM6-12 TaxID=3345149 RepID=UPI003787B10F
MVGAPCPDARRTPALTELALPGSNFRELRQIPTFRKHAGRPLRAVRLRVADQAAFRPVRTTAAMLATLRRRYPDDFAWHRADGAYVIDLLPPTPPAARAGDGVLLYP